MPKIRPRDKIAQEIAISPWQERRKSGTDASPDALYSVAQAPLIAPSPAHPSYAEQIATDAAAGGADSEQDGEDDGGWITKAPRNSDGRSPGAARASAATAASGPAPMDEDGDDNTAPPSPQSAGSLEVPPELLREAHGAADDAEAASSSGPEQGEEDRSPCHQQPLAGVCRLAITPAGRGMGHILLTPHLSDGGPGASGGGGGGGAVALGLALRRLAPAVPLDPCIAGDDWADLMIARLVSFETGATAHCLVSCSGGDMVRLGEPEDWLLRRCLGEEAAAELAEAAEAAELAAAAAAEAEAAEEEEGGGAGGGGGRGAGAEAGATAAAAAALEADAAALQSAHARAEEEGHRASADDAAAVAAVASAAAAMAAALRSVTPGLRLTFQAESLVSGPAALPLLVEFAKPLLPSRSRLADGEARGEGGGAGASGAGAEPEAVVCVGRATLVGVPPALLGAAVSDDDW
ncbi:hypothetical protein HYH03_007711 [Edaphochlamys debaryana]|uniref:Uncharacterized protein n=1 Tax=Edaphochlamys debaryana TaxID=47281 RepID=A0A836C038_9CHLO|nr:hypothetical protein HYH03_007711 [Edaphochlamys debaryana]|eukprot:KAG2494068.1 hypothetical protein HYH03_007711 [Edaphochlamys debaryana]